MAKFQSYEEKIIQTKEYKTVLEKLIKIIDFNNT